MTDFTLWVDADACPKLVKEVLFRAAQRVECALILVANQPLSTPPSPFIRSIQVEQGFDVADNYIVQRAKEGDLVISSDIPLAAELIPNGVSVINVRGEQYTKNNIAQRLNIRDFMETMRSSGEHTGGPPPYSNTDKLQFANALDRWIAKRLK